MTDQRSPEEIAKEIVLRWWDGEVGDEPEIIKDFAQAIANERKEAESLHAEILKLRGVNHPDAVCEVCWTASMGPVKGGEICQMCRAESDYKRLREFAMKAVEALKKIVNEQEACKKSEYPLRPSEQTLKIKEWAYIVAKEAISDPLVKELE